MRSPQSNKIILKSWLFVVLLLLLGITYKFYVNAKNNAIHELQTEFSRYTQEFNILIRERMLAYEQVLYGTKGLFKASNSVERDEFKEYINALDLQKHFPGIQGVGYSIIVHPKEKESLIEHIRAEGFGSFNITPTSQRELYTTIIYLEPFDERNQRAFGYDMYSESTRNRAMQQSRDESRTIISGKVKLLQEFDHDIQAGFLMYLPVYKNGVSNESIAQRRENIIGWVYAPFRMRELMQGLKGYTDSYFDIEIYDDNIIEPATIMYDSKRENHASLFSDQISFEVAGRTWAIIIKSTPEFDRQIDRGRADFILMAGLILSLLIVFTIYQIIDKNAKIETKATQMNRELLQKRSELHTLNANLERRVEQKTQELQKSNEILAQNVSDLNILNSKLLKAKEEALQAAQARSNFISAVSHELRTPLNSIINFTDQVIEDFDEMLGDSDLQQDTQMFLGRVLVNSKHLLTLINDLLEFTKAEAGKMDYSFKETEINTILLSAYNNTNSLLNGTEVTFSLQLCDEPLMALIDARRFLQILLNLLSNAIKFTKKGFIQLRSFKEGSHIIIEVEDSGKGIPQDRQSVVFEPFMQVDATDAGTGLGLGLAKRMCDDMDIDISFTSKQHIGTTFRLVLKSI